MKINGERHYLWRAVDHEGEILESFVTKKRAKAAALAVIKKTLKRHGRVQAIVTDGLKSYLAAMRELGNLDRREMGRWSNNRVEKFTPVAAKAGANDAEISIDEDTPEIWLGSRLVLQSLQLRTSPRQSPNLQSEVERGG
ncbi:MAG: DDE-type integrase/transposase/recombinase [Croceibacterium sp.]